MMQITEQTGPFVRIDVRDELTKLDYQTTVPLLEKQIETQGKLRAMIVLDNLKSVDLDALLEDLKFDLKHRKDFERCAIVGDHEAERWATKISSPFFSGDMKYFDREDAAAARTWVES